MKRFFSAVLMFAMLICTGTALADTKIDPLVSYSYINNSYIASILSDGDSAIDDTFEDVQDALDNIDADLTVSTGAYTGYDFATSFTMLELSVGGSVTIPTGGSMVMVSGTALLDVKQGTALNLSTGFESEDGTLLKLNERYFAPEDSVVSAVVFSDSAVVMVDGYYKFAKNGALPDTKVFFDINGHWAKEYIMYLADLEIMNGMSTFEFQPETNVTREMFVTLLGRMFDVNIERYPTSVFPDVTAGSWYAPYVSWAAKTGVVMGYDTGLFGTGESITRQQMAVLIMRYAEYANISLREKVVNPMPFGDEDKIADWALDGVLMAQKTGLISGRTGNVFDPDGTATRAEAATIIYRLLTQ